MRDEIMGVLGPKEDFHQKKKVGDYYLVQFEKILWRCFKSELGLFLGYFPARLSCIENVLLVSSVRL